MTATTPRWLLLALLGLLVTAGAYLLGRSAANTDSLNPATTAPEEQPSATQRVPECSRRAATEALFDSRAQLGIRRLGGVGRGRSALAEPRFGIEKLICRDLAGAGAEEMVVQLACCTASSPTPWAIFRSENDRWALSFYRDEIPARLTVKGDEIVEKTPAYNPDDEACCPSAFRFGRVAWDGDEFVYSSDDADPDRKIKVSGEGVSRVGPFRPERGAPLDAAESFGRPSFVSPRDGLCIHEWRDLGLTINFANLGGQDPCGPNGRVGSIELGGVPAEQAGWETEQRVRVGMAFQSVRKLYPDARSVPNTKGAIALIEGPSPIGDGNITPVLSARAQHGEVSQLGLSVGAAGE